MAASASRGKLIVAAASDQGNMVRKMVVRQPDGGLAQCIHNND